MRRLVVLESPFAASETRSEQDNMDYLGECIWDSLFRGEAPIASHGLYPRWLDDRNYSLRKVGMECGAAWVTAAKAHVFYTDYGWSTGMIASLQTTTAQVEIRALYGAPVPAPKFENDDQLQQYKSPANAREDETESPLAFIKRSGNVQ